ncbi:MAG: DUF4064 domain-containing protein [Clostridia bacterium]|nr:DUF4064 domain-containing protein [Clostridia bacterium]
MRKASVILGIIGGGIAILLALSFIIQCIKFNHMDFIANQDIPFNEIEQMSISCYFVGIAYVVLAAGLLGVVGGAIAKNNTKIAGIFMIIASIITLITLLSIIACPLLLLGGIFALTDDKKAKIVETQSK